MFDRLLYEVEFGACNSGFRRRGIEVQFGGENLLVVMFTPQKLWSLTPKRGSGSGPKSQLGPNSGDGTVVVAKGKSVTIFEPRTPASGSVLGNGDDRLVGSGGATMDRDVLVERITNLEKEVCLLVVLTFIL